ncbi:DUF4290 domain-containing protein [Albibacterium bauzanense]|uniref:Uncharacterized protein DUF4290 n=1 Tax=Albibacterium bauzanense TaxID=653929 RepID=A0A4R1M0R4_9SPHI|nr:DUF4290 domain-containing protein [Albibacterium bauzanense]TCK85506.1 uncharacterized protein DUF4290 [Albibacterium bauzanense]
MEFDYNSTRSHLILAEYGRNVQNMVDYICTLPTREERNKYAQVVIDLMGFLNPHLRDVADFKHKLWDHLFIISGFKIDVDCPYPRPVEGSIRSKPEILAYPQNRIKFKHYGKTVEKMINAAKAIEDPQRKEHMILSIANFMKMAYVTWNKDSVIDETIINDLKELSNGELQVSDDLSLAKVEFKTPPPGSRTRTAQNTKGRSNGSNNKNQGQSNGYNKKRNTGKRY